MDTRHKMTDLIDSQDLRPVHLIGICGAGMSGLARLLQSRGVVVQGTDSNPSSASQSLSLANIKVTNHDASSVAFARAVIYSSAIPADHPEMIAARAAGISTIRRAEALGQIVNTGTVIGIAGTHGKTTTTAMTTLALKHAGLKPTGVVGGTPAGWDGNILEGRNDLHVVEADEYDRSFLALKPTVATVLNVGVDHLDIYKDLDDIRSAFKSFISPSRAVVLCADDMGSASLDMDSTREVIRYSVPEALSGLHADARLVARSVEYVDTGSRAEVYFDGKFKGYIRLNVPGVHNLRNALAALASGILVGADIGEMIEGLGTFRGVGRRFQILGEYDGVTVVDDYAHHPDEVNSTIDAARRAYPDRRLVVAFQPHLYSRTRDFYAGFAEALIRADVCFLCDIYPAREQAIFGVTSELISDHMYRLGRPPIWRGGQAECSVAVREMTKPGDVVIAMGAGDITHTAKEILMSSMK